MDPTGVGTTENLIVKDEMNEDGGYFDALKRVSLKLLSKEHNLAMKRTAADLVAQVAWDHGVPLLKELVPYLISLSEEGACEAELVCLILRSISSIGIASATDVEAGKVEMHLHGISEFLPQILPLLCSLLDKHAQAASIEHSNQHVELANQHECTVIAVLDAALAYMEWTPLCDPANLDIIQRGGYLLRSNIFSTHSLRFLKSVWQRKRSVEPGVAVSIMFPILMNVSHDHLRCMEPEYHGLDSLWPSLGYHTNVHAKTVDRLFELLSTILETCQDPSKPHSDRLLTCSTPMSQGDEISCTSVLENGTVVSADPLSDSDDYAGPTKLDGTVVSADPLSDSDDYAGPTKLDTSKEADYLVEENNTLSEAFIDVPSCPWIQNYTELLSSILFPLSKIWGQLEMHHLCDSQFRTSLHNVTVFFVEERGIYQEEKSNHSSLKALVPLILSMLLKLLQYVHSLDMEELEEAVDSYCIEATDGDELLESIRVWLIDIRRNGYKFIGMCAYLDTAFDEWLKSTLICGVLRKDIESMDFRHVTWIIEYAIIPLVEKCPPKLWTEWIDSLLQPLCHYCDYTLHASWCNILYNDTEHVNETFDDNCVSEEEGKNLRMGLFKLTREVSNLLAAVASPELNDGKTNEGSLISYLLHHDGLNDSIRRLIRNIFGYWTDNDAMMKAALFCRKLFHLASITRSDNLISCVKDDIIPNIIRYLALQPNLKSSSNMDDVLTQLCKDAYNCIHNQKLTEECTNDGSSSDTFKSWLRKQIKVTQYQNTSLDELEEFAWIWEIEEEFRGYLPTYTAMLHAVDKFGDGLKDGHFLCDAPCELMNKFISSAGIDSSSGSYHCTLSSMLSRKMSSLYWKRQNEQRLKFYCKLIKFKPYIKCTGSDENLQQLIENNSEEWPLLPRFHRDSACEIFCRVLELWEPQFHPLIREGHMNVLTEIAEQLASGEYNDSLLPFQAVETDFLGHLQPYARSYIDEKNKETGYYSAKEQAELHKEFDIRLASGAFDHYVRQDGFPTNIIDDGRFADLDCNLLKLSLERREKLLNDQDQLSLYYKRMESLLVNEKLRDSLQSLMSDLEAEGFFCVDDDSIEWGKKRFSELVDNFEGLVFSSLNLPKYFVIRGIMDFWQIVQMKDTSLEDVFGVIVGGPCQRWMANLSLFWMDTRHYKHAYYDTIQDPIKKVWKKA